MTLHFPWRALCLPTLWELLQTLHFISANRIRRAEAEAALMDAGREDGWQGLLGTHSGCFSMAMSLDETRLS